MAKQVFSNAASCKLGAAIVTTNPISEITLQTGNGAKFPSPTGGDWFVLAIWKADKSAVELFKITSRTGDVLTVAARAFDGSTAATFGVTDLCLCVINAGAIADLRADMAVLQADVNTAEGDITALEASVDDINTKKPRMDVGTKAVFFQAAAPTGWTQDTSVNDRVLRLVNSTGAGTGGSWTITGFAVQGHALTTDQIPSHTHTDNYMVSTTAYFSGGTFQGYSIGPAGTTTTGATGGGQEHTHGIAHTPGWRPAYADVIVCSRAS